MNTELPAATAKLQTNGFEELTGGSSEGLDTSGQRASLRGTAHLRHLRVDAQANSTPERFLRHH
jgi:hypothetical protein